MQKNYQELKVRVKALLKRGLSRRKIKGIMGLSNASMTYCEYLIGIEQQGFSRPVDEKNSWARQKGYKSYSDYQKTRMELQGLDFQKAKAKRAKKKRLKSVEEYDDYLAVKAGFCSNRARTAFRIFERQQRPDHKELGELIQQKLLETGKTQTWLAGKIGVSKQEVSYYAQAKAFPRDGKLEKLLGVLEVNRTYLIRHYPNLAGRADY